MVGWRLSVVGEPWAVGGRWSKAESSANLPFLDRRSGH
jgi:hypothetical protein